MVGLSPDYQTKGRRDDSSLHKPLQCGYIGGPRSGLIDCYVSSNEWLAEE